MKKSFLLGILIAAFCFTANAQFAKLLDFTGQNGSNPSGDLISDGTFLYGMTYRGGLNNEGLLFKIKPDGTGYADLLDFTGSAIGGRPMGSLYFDGTFLYGMTSIGGSSAIGTLFKILPTGSGYVKLLDFTGPNGSWPRGALCSDGTFLYGMTWQGGANNLGTIFKIKKDGSLYSDLLDFAGTSNGSSPYGSLIADGTFLYGTTRGGGANGDGTIFKIMYDGTGYSKLFDFTAATTGGGPCGTLYSDGTALYGTTFGGGSNSGGLIFKILPNGTGYTSLFNFTCSLSGCRPEGSLISDGIFLYGMTSFGGTIGADTGAVFKVKMDGSLYSVLYGFGNMGINGSWPSGSLYSDGTFLYGLTNRGGTSYEGTFFKFNLMSITANMVGNPICSTQCDGAASVTVTGGSPPFTYSWSTTPVQTTATATGLCSSTYTISVTDQNGFSSSNSVSIASLPAPTTPSICAVTVDSLSQFNTIMWDKTSFAGSGVDSFVVYREITTNNYMPIGSVPLSSLSMFIDTVRTKYFPYTGNPNNGTYRYKIATRDTCGNFSAKSLYHNTIFSTNTNGTFSWNFYTIEGTPNPVPGYLLMRDDNSNGAWHAVAGVSGTQQTVTDAQYSTYQNTASWRIETQWNISCTPTLKNHQGLTSSINASKSNAYESSNTSVNEISLGNSVVVFPSPNDGEFQISSSRFSFQNVDLYNLYGENVYSSIVENSGPFFINVHLAEGIYFVQIRTEKGTAVKKIIISR